MNLKRYEMAELLLDHGADPLVSHWKKETSLLNATMSMNLLRCGADPNITVGVAICFS
ncbi:hypothetical protein PITC_014350 [Penicillium italicum]|uniref:Ankyrin repeat-containing domain-containing protein n=1 Tax=Penicillium italicum TaxID=40296 RepID=A0A0A2KYQ4_PENIT|nr:hypothetical protein PITC_014350 [Penicillium italicum]